MSIVQRLRSHVLYLLSPTWEKTGLPGGAVVKNLPTRAGEARELGSIPGLGRSLGVGNGNPLQYSCLENPTDRGVWWATVHGVARSQTQISIHTTDQLRKDKASQMKRMFRRFDCCFFPNRPLGKESACNARDPSLIPGSGKQRGYPLQYSWAFLLAQLVTNPHAMWEIWVRSLGWEDSLEKGKSTHSSLLPWRIPWTV